MAGFFSWLSSLPLGGKSGVAGEALPRCFHCGLRVPGDLDLWVEFEGQRRPACCTACQALFELVLAQGMSSYYHQRDQRAAV
jgi:hypothetical protein